GDDRAAVAVLAGIVHRAVVVAHVERARLGGEAALAHGVEQRRDVVGLVATGGGDLPRDGEISPGADGEMEPEAVEAAALAGGNGRGVAPRRVRVAELPVCPLAPALRNEPLAVRIGGQVRGVNSNVASEIKVRGAQGTKYP